jgi:hypothetical protein
MALSSITIKQSKGTPSTMEKAKQLLDYLATYPNTKIQFHASNIVMNVYLDALYLPEVEACSRACGDGPP